MLRTSVRSSRNARTYRLTAGSHFSSAAPDAWEHHTCCILARRFGEQSTAGFDRDSLHDPAILRQLESFPTVLVYETSVDGDYAHVARYGSISRLRREDGDLVFEFTPNPERGFLPRGVLMKLAGELGIHRYQWRRTHWAVIDGELNQEVLRRAGPEPPRAGVPLLYAAYREAVRAGYDEHAAAVQSGLNELPPSEEKALAYLRSAHQGRLYLPAFCVLGYRRRSPDVWEKILRLHDGAEIVTDPLPQAGTGSLPFLLASFYDRYGGPTECERMNEAAEDCLAIMAEVEADFRSGGGALPSLAYVMWRTGQSSVLARYLRRRLRLVIDRLMEDRPSSRIWPADDLTPDHRTTAMLTVGMLRVGDDKHRRKLRLVVKALCHFQRPDGGFAARGGETTGDVLTTALVLEAIFRTGLAEELTNLLDRAESWLWRRQLPSGVWRSSGWHDDAVTTAVAAYFESRPTILPQVDGFFLMARDFYVHACDLIYQDGKNNRRLATIALVHAMEMFLYGVFERCHELGVSIYRDKGDETIGPREALRVLQEALRRTKTIAPRATLSFRDQLSRLIRERDSVIHHAGQVGREEVEAGRKTVSRFIGKYGLDLCGIDLLQ